MELNFNYMAKKIEEELLELIESSVKLSCRNEKKIGVVFSAGLDSTIIAFLASKFAEVNAYTVGEKNSEDIKYANEIKKINPNVNLNFIIKEIKTEDVKEILPKILNLINEPKPLQISCAIPVYIAANEAKKDGINLMLSGQGGDELFLGYYRYLQYINDKEKIFDVMRRDIECAYADNLNRDITMCKLNGVELAFPYMNKKLVEFAMKIPVELKIKELFADEAYEEFSCVDNLNGKKFIRKYILRKIAKEIGIPKFIINRKKKALQYGSKSMKILKIIAKENGYSTIYDYLNSIKS